MTKSQPAGPVLLVDVGGVLLLHNAELLLPIVAKYGGVDTPEDFQRAHYATHNAVRPARGPQSDYYDHFGHLAGVPEERRADFRQEYLSYSKTQNMCHFPDPASKATLAELAAEGVPIAVVSQADGKIAQMLWDAEMCQEGEGPGVRVDVILDSTVVGLDKPDPKFFTYALDQVGAQPEQAVHVGDTVPADVRGAQAAGIRAIHYDPYGDCDDDPADHDHITKLADVRPFLNWPVGQDADGGENTHE